MKKYIITAFLLLNSLCWAQSKENTIKSFQAPYNLKDALLERMNLDFDQEEGDIFIDLYAKINPKSSGKVREANIEINLKKIFVDEPAYTLKVNSRCEFKQKRNKGTVFNEGCIEYLSSLIETNLKLLEARKPVPRATLANSIMPKYYTKRSKPVLNLGIVYYGDYYTEEDLSRVQKMIEERFHLATNRLLSIDTKFKRVIPFKNNIQDFPEYRQDYVTDPDRLQRLWYYDNVGKGVVNEVYDQVKNDLKEIDVVLLITGAQFDGLAFSSGRVAVMENPREIAWAKGGSVEYLRDEKVADVLIHELGHSLYLGHASDQCFQKGMSLEETAECCKQSPSGNDIMSYCRDRNAVDEDTFYKFGSCNLRNIKDKIIPAIMSGGEWIIKDIEMCK